MNVDLGGSRLLVLARRSRRLPHPLLAVALALLFDVAPLGLFVAVVSADVLPDRLVPSALAQTALLSAVYGLYIFQVGVWVKLWEQRPIATLGLERTGALSKLLRGGLLGVGIYGAILVILASLQMIEVRSDASPGQGWAIAAAAFLAMGGWAVQGTAEELLYRGWLLPVVTARSRLAWGIAVSSVVFALSHLLGSAFDSMLLVNLLLFGVFFAMWALREGGLWGVIGWHTGVNWVSENLIVVGEGFGVGLLADGLLLGINEGGADLLTGGTTGLEASLLTTGMLASGIAVLAGSTRRAQHPHP